MIAHSIFFYFFSVVAIISAIMVTASKNTVHSVFFLILDFISISCLFIMIGAIVLTYRQREGVKKQSYVKQISRERSEGIEIIEVASNKGVKIDD